MSQQTAYSYELGQFRIEAIDRLLPRFGEVLPLALKAFDVFLPPRRIRNLNPTSASISITRESRRDSLITSNLFSWVLRQLSGSRAMNDPAGPNLARINKV